VSERDIHALAEITARDLEELHYDKAILPIGATEYHGPHLPFSTDTIAAEALARRIAREIDGALVLPSIAYGMSLHMLAWPWSLSLQPETLTRVVVDIAESLLQHDISKLLVISTHDGNPPCIENAARVLSDNHGMTVAILDGWQEMARSLLEGTYDIDLDHGGQSEMSMTLVAAPHLVRQDLAADLPRQRMEHPLRVRGPFSNVVPHGYSGAPSQGSAEEGEAILDAIAGGAVPFLRDLDDHGWTNGSWMSGIAIGSGDRDPRKMEWRL
jgi:creatinine amidohydrolase